VQSVQGHLVYIGKSLSDVNDANTSSSLYKGAYDSNSFSPDTLLQTLLTIGGLIRLMAHKHGKARFGNLRHRQVLLLSDGGNLKEMLKIVQATVIMALLQMVRLFYRIMVEG